MKSKMLIILNTVALALNLMALDPNAPSTPTAANSGAKACCDHAKTAHWRPARCAKDAACCRHDAKCCQGGAAVTSKDHKPANACPIMEKEEARAAVAANALLQPSHQQQTDMREGV